MARLLEEATAGSEEAARQLTEGYGSYLLITVRRWLNKRLRNQFDSVDFVQDVWASFFARGCNKETFQHPQQLIRFLQHMARNKVVSALRNRQGREKIDVGSAQPPPEDRELTALEIMDEQPTPSQIVSRDEEWEKVLQSEPPAYRVVLVLYRAGKSPSGISRQLEISVKTVNRVIDRAMNKLRSTF